MDPTHPPAKLIARTVVPMHREPDAGTEQVSQALLGQRVLELAAEGAWRRVETPDGYPGWLLAETLVDAPPAWKGPWVEVTDLWANFRARNDYRLAAAGHAIIGTRLPWLGEAEERRTRVCFPDGRELWTESHRLERVERDPIRPAEPRAITRTARRFLGVPYLWGGSSPVGIDCSGFVQLVMRLHGIELLRDAHQQAGQGEETSEPAAADLVFFGPEERPDAISHVGMMLDGKRFIHAAGSDRVRINRLSDAPYDRQFRGGRRYL